MSKPRIMSRMGWKESYSEVCVSTPRRFGKTFSIAIYAACMALSFGVEIVIFSPARRASRKILERIKEFVTLLGADDKITEYNQENLRLRAYDGKLSLIRSFPSAVASLKGVSGQVVVLEEAAYCDPQLVSEVVIPLLSMQSSCLLCISTLLDGANHYSKMMELRDDLTGQPLFRNIQITLVCEACMKTEHPERCTHKLSSLPRWISSKKVETVRTLLSDDPAMLLRETLGVACDGSTKAYRYSDIEAFVSRKPSPLFIDPARPNDCVRHCFVAIDPSGGGASAFAIATVIVMHTGSVQVVGAEALVTREVRRTHELLVQHIEKVRSLPLLEHTTVVIVAESNLGFESQHLLHAITGAKVKRWLALSEGPQGSLGLLTTADRKEQYCLLLREALTVGSISLSRGFFSISLGAEQAKRRLQEELLNFSIVTQAPLTSFGKTRKTYTGKIAGKQDDLTLALQMAMYGARSFFTSSKYAAHR